jgi:ferredoxin-thioredoxin reductase catalytic subunit
MRILVKKGWKLNPNEKVVKAIIKRINKCDGECPCDNPGETLEDRICPCKEYRENNICHCNLYVYENNN